MNGVPTSIGYEIGAIIAAVIALLFVLIAAVTLRDRHRQGDGWHVYLGALFYGLLFGVMVGFVLAPMRLAMMNGELPTNIAGPSGLVVFAAIIALRRGLLARLPFLGPQVKAYRRASLRRVIETAEKQLAKLGPSRGAALEGVV